MIEEKFEESVVISNPDATNYQYVDNSSSRQIKNLFISYANSYYGKFIMSEILSLNSFENDDDQIEYRICGTMQGNQAIEGLNIEILDVKNENFFSAVSQCDLIICDISQDKLQFEESRMIIEYLENELENGRKGKFNLIILSTILTWAATAQNDEILTESDYRMRRPHPCYVCHLLLEEKVMNLKKKYKKIVNSLVICPGIIYGDKQDIFHYVFKSAFFNHPYVNLFMPGTNYLPIIYIHDFVKIIIDAIINFRENSKNYILAVQPNPIIAYDIIKTFADAIGGSEIKIKICEKHEIFSMSIDKMTQRVFNYLTVNLRLQSDHLQEFQFTIDGPNLENNAEKIAQEFYDSRNLKPIKILIDGSIYTKVYQQKLAKLLSSHYCLHGLDRKCFLKGYQCRLATKIYHIEEYLKEMNEMSAKCPEEALNFKDMISSTESLLDSLKDQKQRVDELVQSDTQDFEHIKEFLLDNLKSQACSKHQGYVMSNFQLEPSMASHLFLNESEDNFNDTAPDYVIVLNRSLSFDERCIDEEASSKMTSKASKAQHELKNYYINHSGENSLLNFFLDRELVPTEITINRDMTDDEMQEIFESLKSKIGKPQTYELSKEEQDEIEKIKKEIAELETAKREENERLRLEKEMEEKQEKAEKWNAEVMETKKKEFLKMEQQSLPVRQYLMKYIFPKIADGFVEVTRVRPENPIQFLGNYLFQQNTEAKCDSEIDQDVLKEFERLSKCQE